MSDISENNKSENSQSDNSSDNLTNKNTSSSNNLSDKNNQSENKSNSQSENKSKNNKSDKSKNNKSDDNKSKLILTKSEPEYISEIKKFHKKSYFLKKQLASIYPKMLRDKDIQELAKRNYGNSWNKPELFKLAILQAVPPPYIFEKKFFIDFFCYHNKRDDTTIYLNKIIYAEGHVFVIEGNLRSENQFVSPAVPVVIKWYGSKEKNITFETNIYKKLYKLGCPVPKFSSHFSFWDSPILVLEKLFPINPRKDDIYIVAIEILKQLKYLHNFGVHTDIKPDNIMKNHKNIPYLIDYGGIALIKFDHGYKRNTWNSRFTSQVPFFNNQVTTAKNDFLELGYTLNHWENGPKYKNFKSEFNGKIGKYMYQVNQINEKKIKPNIYEDLIACLK